VERGSERFASKNDHNIIIEEEGGRDIVLSHPVGNRREGGSVRPRMISQKREYPSTGWWRGSSKLTEVHHLGESLGRSGETPCLFEGEPEILSFS